MPTIIINETEIEFNPNENMILSCRRAGVEVPHYCWHESLSVVASCRMCLVEVGQKSPDGTIQMGPRLVPACQTPVRPSMVVKTNSPKVQQSTAMTLEYLLLNHPLDCSVCDQAGECYLQDYSFKFGKPHSRLDEPKILRNDKYHIGEQIALFTDRCVMCTRCVRFTREISGTAELQVVARGAAEEIDVFPGQPCNNKLAGNVVDLCPVGALCSKDFLYKKRVWWLRSQNSVCAGCSTGCSIHVDQNDNHVYRLRPRSNPSAQGNFMCDEGRFGFKYIHDKNRLTAPIVRLANHPIWNPSVTSANNQKDVQGNQPHTNLNGDEDSFADVWPETLSILRNLFSHAAANFPDRFVAVFSPFMTCEEAYLLASYLKDLSPQVRLVLGPTPIIGEDDSYPKGPKGQPPISEQTRFTIRAEKCPNRKGVEMILSHFQSDMIRFDDIATQSKSVDVWYFVGGYPTPWVTPAIEKLVSSATTLVVQDILPSSLSAAAHIVLPSGSFAEREGTFVNHAGLAQTIKPAIRPPGNARSDGRLFMEISERRGLFNAEVIRREMAAEIPAFAALKVGDLGERGVSLSSPNSTTPPAPVFA